METNRLVLDISHHNTVESWEKIRKAGVVGVILKCTEGWTYVDDTYKERAPAAKKAGLLVGAYHYLRAGSMRDQVKHFVKNLILDEDTLVAADHEEGGVSLGELKEFMRELDEQTKRSCVLYSGHLIKEQLGNRMDSFLAEHRLWIAHYNQDPSWPQCWKEFWIWQYSDGASGPEPKGCPGVSGYVDTNSFQRDPAELVEEWPGTWQAPPEEQVVAIAIEAPPGIKVTVNGRPI